MAKVTKIDKQRDVAQALLHAGFSKPVTEEPHYTAIPHDCFACGRSSCREHPVADVASNWRDGYELIGGAAA